MTKKDKGAENKGAQGCTGVQTSQAKPPQQMGGSLANRHSLVERAEAAVTAARYATKSCGALI